MDNSWRAGIFGAIAAFVVSVLFGILGGVGIGTILLRALVGAAVFAGLGIGAYRIAQGFLPELLSSDPKPVEGAVDISIPDINPHETAEGEGGDEAYAPRAEPVDTEYEEGSLPPKQDWEEKASDPVSLDPGPQQEVLDTLDPVSSPDPEPMGEPGGGSLQSLDSLPDLGALETSFSSPLRETTRGGESLGGSSEKDPDKDPVVLAKVVQSLLQKEKEG